MSLKLIALINVDSFSIVFFENYEESLKIISYLSADTLLYISTNLFPFSSSIYD